MSVLARIGQIFVAWGFWLAVLVALAIAICMVAVGLALAPLIVILWLVAEFLYWVATRIAVLCDAETGGRRHCWSSMTDALVVLAVGAVIGLVVWLNLMWIDQIYRLIVGWALAVLGHKPDAPDSSSVAVVLNWIAAQVSLPVVLAGLAFSLAVMFGRVRGEARRLTAVECARP